MIRRQAHLRWKKEEPERGLRAVIAHPRGSSLHDGTTEYASVSASNRRGDQWYWVARCDAKGVPLKNTCVSPVATEQEAKVAALAYVRECLSAAARTMSAEAAG